MKPKFVYTLKAKPNHFTVNKKTGEVTLVFEESLSKYHPWMNDADASGEFQALCLQADLLWDLFDHEFEVFDKNGKVVEYDMEDE